MVRPETLVPGNCYFMVGFHDRELLFPFISTLKYVRCEMDPEHGRSWLFEEPNDPLGGAEDSTDGSLLAISDDLITTL